MIALPVGMSFTHTQVHYSGDAVITERGVGRAVELRGERRGTDRHARTRYGALSLSTFLH